LSSCLDNNLARRRDTLMTGTGSDGSEALARGGGIAVWRRIADSIEAEIAGRGLDAGTRLPTEAELSQRFRVNRHTVRRALAALAADGVVEAARGSGTFVRRPRIPYPIGPHTRFTAIMNREGHVAGSELIEHAERTADAEAARRLAIAPGAPVLRVRMKRFSDGVPVSVGTSLFPLPRFAGFVEAFLQTGAVTPALARCGVPDYRRLQTRVAARAASPAEAAELALDAAERILLVTESVNVDGQGVPIQATEALFAAARIELVVGEA
jgi:GntR family transcriptional regulator, phosphonate transport system regulatory protein